MFGEAVVHEPFTHPGLAGPDGHEYTKRPRGEGGEIVGLQHRQVADHSLLGWIAVDETVNSAIFAIGLKGPEEQPPLVAGPENYL